MFKRIILASMLLMVFSMSFATPPIIMIDGEEYPHVSDPC